LSPRIAAIREAVGIAAYQAGEYALALVELRAARRMDGSPRHLPLMADAERGLGRPERALAYLTDPDAGELDAAGHAELLVVVAGARRDLGEPDAAVVLLQDAAREPGLPHPWTARLRYAYADALAAAGREEEALRAFESTAAIDEDETDAAERALRLRGVEPGEDDEDGAAPSLEMTDDIDDIDDVDRIGGVKGVDVDGIVASMVGAAAVVPPSGAAPGDQPGEDEVTGGRDGGTVDDPPRSDTTSG
jgi:tetratricopeptide (TPR) repeat protein